MKDGAGDWGAWKETSFEGRRASWRLVLRTMIVILLKIWSVFLRSPCPSSLFISCAVVSFVLVRIPHFSCFQILLEIPPTASNPPPPPCSCVLSCLIWFYFYCIFSIIPPPAFLFFISPSKFFSPFFFFFMVFRNASLPSNLFWVVWLAFSSLLPSLNLYLIQSFSLQDFVPFFFKNGFGRRLISRMPLKGVSIVK